MIMNLKIRTLGVRSDLLRLQNFLLAQKWAVFKEGYMSRLDGRD